MKIHVRFFCALLACASATQATENPYDVFGKTLAPFVNLFAKDGTNSAMSAELSILEMTGLSPEFNGAKASFEIETPDKFRVDSQVLGEPATVCRSGDEIWIAPGAQIEALTKTRGELPKPDKKFKLGRIELPIPPQQLVFLPALFQVRDVGESVVNGSTCRVLDVTLMPALAQSLKVEQWAARVWVRPDYTPERITLAKPLWHIAVDFKKMYCLPSLPAATWQSSAEQSDDVLHLDAPRFKQLLDAAMRGLK